MINMIVVPGGSLTRLLTQDFSTTLLNLHVIVNSPRYLSFHFVSLTQRNQTMHQGDTPSERRITERRITERRITERRITKRRITER
jgi:hypothetical protein